MLPSCLVRAHRDGRLALFVGAGASKPCPSNLPLLGELVERVEKRLGVDHEPGSLTLLESGARECSGDSDGESLKPLERLEELARRGLSVHVAVKEIISESAEPNDVHRAIVALAEARGSARIVTTNYDRHLSGCLSEPLAFYEAPDFPGDEDFTGVVHLHGSIGQSPERLVITESDFARSYMQWNSPTFSFLHRMLASQAVLFVGYSAEDILMKFILRAVGGRSDLFALTRSPDLSHWGDIGVHPIGFGEFGDLPVLLSEWAERAKATVEDHTSWVARIIAETPDSGDLSAQDESYLSEVVADLEHVNTFTTQAKGPTWLRWAATHLKAKLFTPGARLTEAEKEMAGWFTSQFNEDDESADEAVRLIGENGGHLHEYLWLNMVGPDPRGGASREAANRMLLGLADAVPADADLARCALGLLDECDASQDDDLFLELVDRVFAPRLRLPTPLEAAVGHIGPFRAAANDPSDDWLSGSPNREFWARRRHLAADLLSIIDGHIRRACRIDDIAGNPDPFEHRAAVEEHEWNSVKGRMHFLVDAARHLHDVLAEDQPETAAGYLRSWEESRWPVQNRLAIYVWANRVDASGDEKIEWLLQHDGWASDNKLHHEAMLLMAKAAPKASEEAIEALIEQITGNGAGADENRAAFNRLGWIAQHAPDSAVARQAYQLAQTESPDSEMPDHPEFLHDFQSKFIVDTKQYLDGLEPHDLVELISSDPAGAAAHLIDADDRGGPIKPMTVNWSCALRSVHGATRLSAIAGLELLEALVEQPAQNPESRGDIATYVLLGLGKEQAIRETVAKHRERIEPLLPKLWDAATTAHWGPSHYIPTPDGWFHRANNAWPGQLVALCIQKINSQKESDPNPTPALPPQDRQFLETAITGDTPDARLAQTACAHHLELLHAIDPNWATKFILPLLDPSNKERAVRCWDAYLLSRQWTPQLLQDGLLQGFIGFAPHAKECCENARKGFARLAAELCLCADPDASDGPPEWLIQVISNVDEPMRIAFAKSTAAHLGETDPESRSDQWHNWMRHYWKNRIDGFPQPLEELEASALAEWALLLDDDYGAAVDLVLESPASLPNQSNLPYALHRAAKGSGPLTHLIERHPENTARLAAHLLKKTEPTTAQQWDITMTGLISELKDRIDATAFTPLNRQLLRLGWNTLIP